MPLIEKAQTHRGVIRRRFINVSERSLLYKLAGTVHHHTKMTSGPWKGYTHVCVCISVHGLHLAGKLYAAAASCMLGGGLHSINASLPPRLA